MIINLLVLLLVKQIVCQNYFAPSVFLNHGGGPNPVIGEKDNIEIAESLRNISTLVDLKRLNAIIVVTAHREEDIVTISSGEHHDMVYDYTNFPPFTYTWKYNAPGHPVLAGRIRDAFEQAGIPSRLDAERGWDHGVFVPMMLINPSEDIPVVQVSILKNQNAEDHYRIGEVLYQFRKEGVAIFGSGMSYHNMNAFANSRQDDVIVNPNFEQFLFEVCTGNVDNRTRIFQWQEQPEGLESHPIGEADHLMPLVVNIGAGGSKPGRKIFDSVIWVNFKISGYMWDEE